MSHIQQHSRSDNIELFIHSIRELHRISKQFKAKEMRNAFTIRVKMVEMLAQQAFKYSIAVSYLKDSEYQKAADTLDNVYLNLSRFNLRSHANQYGSIATREYDAMKDALDLIDERLKTVKVVCYKPRRNSPTFTPFSRKFREYRRFAKKNQIFSQKSTLNPLAKEWIPKTILNPLAKEWIPETLMPTTKAPIQVKTPEQEEEDAKCNKFNREVDAMLHMLHAIKPDTKLNPETKLIKQCEYICDLTRYIALNADILENPRYHTRVNHIDAKEGFVQVCIRKCDCISKEINAIYDRLRNNKRRANPELRAIKSEALESVKCAKTALKIANRKFGQIVAAH